MATDAEDRPDDVLDKHCEGCSGPNAAARSHVATNDIAREPAARIMVDALVNWRTRMDGCAPWRCDGAMALRVLRHH